MRRPEPIDEEIVLQNNVYIESDTNSRGVISYCNDYFAEISGYSKDELIGQPHSIVRHPDMPKVLFKILWDRIENGQNFVAAVKNMAKDGRYYWVFTDFEIIENKNPQADNSGIFLETFTDLDTYNSNIDSKGYKASRKKISKDVTDILDPLYKKLVEIEKEKGMDASERYLNDFLKTCGDDITVDNLLEEVHRLY